MLKPISQRGFEVSKGDYGRYQVSYKIDNEGLENVSVNRGRDGTVSITADEGDIKHICFDCSQFREQFNVKNEMNKLGSDLKVFCDTFPLIESADFKKETFKEKLRQVQEGYSDSYQVLEFIEYMESYILSGHCLDSGDIQKRILNLEEKLKQASEIYHEVKKILNVDEELKKYSPRFSSESELTLYNILGIDAISQIKSFVEEN